MAKKDKKRLPSKRDSFMHEMASFKKSFDEVFDNFFSSRPFALKIPYLWKAGEQKWKPEIDMYETDRTIVVTANLPGCDKKNINIDVHNNILTVSGEKKEEKEMKNKDFYHKERRFGSFKRSITLPGFTDANKAKADCEKGILKIIFPKTGIERGKGKRINIT